MECNECVHCGGCGPKRKPDILKLVEKQTHKKYDEDEVEEE